MPRVRSGYSRGSTVPLSWISEADPVRRISDAPPNLGTGGFVSKKEVAVLKYLQRARHPAEAPPNKQ